MQRNIHFFACCPKRRKIFTIYFIICQCVSCACLCALLFGCFALTEYFYEWNRTDNTRPVLQLTFLIRAKQTNNDNNNNDCGNAKKK